MATFKFHCPHCDQHIETKEEYLGQTAHCPCCGEEIVIEYDIQYLESKNKKEIKTSKNKKSTNNKNTRITCPSCKNRINIKKYLQGETVNCPKCQFSFSPKKSKPKKPLNLKNNVQKTEQQNQSNNSRNSASSRKKNIYGCMLHLFIGAIVMVVLIFVLILVIRLDPPSETPSKSSSISSIHNETRDENQPRSGESAKNYIERILEQETGKKADIVGDDQKYHVEWKK